MPATRLSGRGKWPRQRRGQTQEFCSLVASVGATEVSNTVSHRPQKTVVLRKSQETLESMG